VQLVEQNVAVAESAPQVDTRSVCIIHTTVGQDFNWHSASRRSPGDSWASCEVPSYQCIHVHYL